VKSKQKLDILLVTFSKFPAQGATATYEYARTLSQEGHRVHVVVAGLGEQKTSHENTLIHTIPLKTTKRISNGNLNFTHKARDKIREIENIFPIDIVHVFYYGGCSRLKTKETHAKWICDIRSGSIKNTALYNLWKKIERRETEAFDQVFYIDPSMARIKSYKIIPLGVNTQLFKPQHDKKTPPPHILVYSGSLAKPRKTHALIETMRILQENPVKLKIIGDGNDRRRLESYTNKLGLNKIIEFTGYLKYQQVPQQLSLSHIGISYIPKTPAYENQPPLKALEYLASGLPVIATNTNGNKLYVKDNYNGLIVRDSPEEIAQATVKLINNKEFYHRLQKNTEKSIQNHKWQSIIKNKLLPAYYSLVN